jgi:formylglycine-generating enzyme required for sulfatase activity
MKAAKWFLVGIVLFGCLSSIDLHHGSAAVKSQIKEEPVIKEEEYVSNPETKENCPAGMIEINGEYCPFVQETCLKWIDSEKEHPFMCDSFAYPTKCLAKTSHMNFCIDKFEAQNSVGQIPEVFIDWFTAKERCQSSNKRLCDIKELTLACEGPDIKPYPYGYKRDIKKCNMGHQWIDPDNTPFEKLDKRAPSGSYETCKSDYGVYDIVGNVDEFSINSDGFMNKAPFKSALFGGHYVNGIRNRCRDQGVPSVTTSHGPSAKNYEMSYRCCSNIIGNNI